VSRTSWTPDRETPKVYARLSGDYNPVHLDEEHARSAGFDTVIVHGMCVVGAAARAAHLWAPSGSMLRQLDVRFAQPVLPDQQVDFDAGVAEKAESLKVSVAATLGDDKKIMNPAAFTFGPTDGAWAVPPKVVVEPDEADVLGDVYRFDDEGVADYLRITAPAEAAADEGVPSMVGLLGMTGALEKAFRGVEPEKPGTWVHLRQAGHFFAPIEVGVDYVCRIQGGLTVVRNSRIGAHVTIPFLVETPTDRQLVSSGACVLLYAFDKEEAR
jgi:hypothetical protein